MRFAAAADLLSTALLYDWTRRGILDWHAENQRMQYPVPHTLQSGGAVRPVIHRNQAEHRPTYEGDAETRITFVPRIHISLFQPCNFHIGICNVVDLRLLIWLAVGADCGPQHLIQIQFPNVRSWRREDRHRKIAALHRGRPVVKVHRTLRLLDDPIAWVFESQQTAVDDAD